MYCRRLQEDFVIEPLTSSSSDVTLIAKHWRYGKDRYGDRVEEVIRYLLRIGCGGSGVFERRSGRLVSWILSDVDRSGMSGHTLDEFRGNGIHIWVLLEHIQTAVDNDNPAYGYIPVSNQASLSNARYLGARLHEKLAVYFIIKSVDRPKL